MDSLSSDCSQNSQALCANCFSRNVKTRLCGRPDLPALKNKPFQICLDCKFKIWLENILTVLNGEQGSKEILATCIWCSRQLIMKTRARTGSYLACPIHGYDRPSKPVETVFSAAAAPVAGIPPPLDRDYAAYVIDCGLGSQETNEEEDELYHTAEEDHVMDVEVKKEFANLGISPTKIARLSQEDEECSDDWVDQIRLLNGQTPSSYQKEIFRFIRDPSGGHAVIEAVAGSGKTQTLIQLCQLIGPGKTCIYLAYNKSAQVHLESLLPKAAIKSGAVVNQTIHSCARGAVTRALARRRRGVKILEKSTDSKALGYVIGDSSRKKQVRSVLMRGYEMCQYSLVKQETEIMETLRRFGITWELEEVIDASGKPVVPLAEFIELIQDMMEFTKKQFLKATRQSLECTFEDLIWLPCVCPEAIPLSSYDFVFVDETQDLNRSQLNFVKRLVENHTGRIIAVGDSNQAIYGFRGADSNAMKRMKEDLKAKVLGLSVSYRCPKSIVMLAQTVSPRIQHAPNAIDGIIRTLSNVERMLDELVVGDFVLSRENAALVNLCFALVRKGVSVIISGNASLRNRILSMLKKAEESIAKEGIDFEQAMSNIIGLAEVKLQKGKASEEYVKVLTDCAKTLLLFYRANPEASIEGVRNLVAKYIVDAADHQRSDVVTLSTVHQAKGLERKKVYVLRKTFYDSDSRRSEEEKNLWYVAITRAMQELVIVDLPRFDVEQQLLYVKAAQMMVDWRSLIVPINAQGPTLIKVMPKSIGGT